jgi:hypothetical protein
MRAPSKYGAVRTVVDGVSFASKKEARRYSELKLLQRAGEIAELRLQPRYPLVVNGLKVCTYVGDFAYHPTFQGATMAQEVVEDAKGFKTPEYKLKAKLFQALQGFPIREV